MKHICPALMLFQAKTLPFLAGVNYTSQLLQLMHLVESDPIKGRKYFSCHSIIYPFLLSLLPNCLTPEDFIFLKTIILLLLLYLFLVLCIVSSVTITPPKHCCPQCSAVEQCHILCTFLRPWLLTIHTEECIEHLLRPFQCPRKSETNIT